MCGRYQAQFSPIAIAKRVDRLDFNSNQTNESFAPKQQVFPTNVVPVITAQPNNIQTKELPKFQLSTMKWGFHQPRQSSSNRALINARSETLLQLPTFRRQLIANKNHRCVVPCSGFYEWHKSTGPGKQLKTPYLIRTNSTDNISFMAAVYQPATQQNEKDCFVIITTSAAEDFQWLHNRQPCFLNSQQLLDTWLDTRIDSEIAVKVLITEKGFSFTRMLKDLSDKAGDGKRPRQNTIESFFKPKSKKRTKSESGLKLDTDIEKKQHMPNMSDKSTKNVVQNATNAQEIESRKKMKLEQKDSK